MFRELTVVGPKSRLCGALILLSLVHSPVDTFASATPCEAMVASVSASAAKGNPSASFVRRLKKRDFRGAFYVLAAEKAVVEAQIKGLSAEETADIDKHWAGIYSGQVISTPINVLAEIADSMDFKKGQKLVDIGSGHGDPGIVLGALHPEVEFLGYDFVGAKVDGAKRMASKLGLRNVQFVKQDLSEEGFQLPEADYFYLFNPVSPDILGKLALQIKEMSKTRTVQVIVYEGGWTPRILEDLRFRRVSTIGERVAVYQYQTEFEPKRSLQEIAEDYSHRSSRKRSSAQAQRDIQDFESQILEMPASERINFLRSLSLDQLLQLQDLLDSILGLDLNHLDKALALDLPKQEWLYGDEATWLGHRTTAQTPWSVVFEVIRSMKLKPGQTVVDIGSGIGRLGLAIGLLHPDVHFVGIEIVRPRVLFAEDAAEKNGFVNVHFQVSHLGNLDRSLPLADHYYLFNPTNRETSDIVAAKLIEVAKSKKFKVHVLVGFQSPLFAKSFSKISDGFIRVYKSPEPVLPAQE